MYPTTPHKVDTIYYLVNRDGCIAVSVALKGESTSYGRVVPTRILAESESTTSARNRLRVLWFATCRTTATVATDGRSTPKPQTALQLVSILAADAESGFAVSHGAYVARCSTCDCKTWYDITSEVNPDINAIARQHLEARDHVTDDREGTDDAAKSDTDVASIHTRATLGGLPYVALNTRIPTPV